MGDTIQIPGGDAGVVRIHGKNKAIAITVDSSTDYCLADPTSGGKQIVCEAWRNLISVGANPIAITNCLNFGNPEKEKVMGQFVETIDGIKQACQYLNFPVVSGNVSFYNETNNNSISPTPTIGGVGLIKNLNNMMTSNFKEVGNCIFIIGKTLGHLYQSEFFKEVIHFNDGPPPKVNLFNEKNNGYAVLDLISKNLVESVHDVSSGGILLSLVEMCIKGKIGANISMPKTNLNKHEYYFGEDQSRYIIEVKIAHVKKLEKFLAERSIFYEEIGKTQKDEIYMEKEFKININELAELNTNWFKKFNT